MPSVPVPATPDERAISLNKEEAASLLPPSLRANAVAVTLVALNVKADVRGPIGVRPLDAANDRVRDTYKFPIRVGDQTDFLGPQELPMWMNSHERRVALRLQAIPTSARIRIHHRVGGNQQQGSFRLSFAGVDLREGVARICQTDAPAVAQVPFSFISAVWKEEADNTWELAVNGALFSGDMSGRNDPSAAPRFRPYLGGA
jgi:hypothetical protein